MTLAGRKKISALSSALFFTLLLDIWASVPVLAHHGRHTNQLLYFADELIEFEGELTEIFWRNPHMRARLSVVGNNGDETIWELELAPGPRQFEAMGLTPESFLGNVKVTGYISRRKPNALGVENFLLPDGREYVQERSEEPRWSNERLERRLWASDPTKIQTAEAVADGIFRMWDGGRIGGQPASIEPDLLAQSLTERARELVAAVRRNVTIDWTVKEGVRANMRVIIKRILRKYGYPPDKVGKATRTVLEQAEVICRELAA